MTGESAKASLGLAVCGSDRGAAVAAGPGAATPAADAAPGDVRPGLAAKGGALMFQDPETQRKNKVISV